MLQFSQHFDTMAHHLVGALTKSLKIKSYARHVVKITKEAVKKVVHKLKVKNALGLHARPAAMIAKLLHGSKSQVAISYKDETVDARSIMSILMLAIKKNSLVTLTAEGDDAEDVMEKLVAAFEAQFGE